MKNDIDILRFLINSYTTTMNTFGQNKKSLTFFINQLNDLVDIGQVSIADRNIIHEILEIKKDNIDFDFKKAEKRVSETEKVIHVVKYYKNTIPERLNDLYHERKISKTVYTIFDNIYNSKESINTIPPKGCIAKAIPSKGGITKITPIRTSYTSSSMRSFSTCGHDSDYSGYDRTC